MYNGVMRALMRMGLADIWGSTRVPLYVLNVTYPLVDPEIVRFCTGKRAVLVVEEGQPDFIEQALSKILREADLPTRLLGKRILPMAGEYTVAVLEDGVRGFFATIGMATELTPRANAAAILDEEPVRALATVVPARPPGFCTGCPERPIFSAMKLVETGTRSAPRRGRYRLPSVLHPAAVQRRRDDDGLRAGAGLGLRAEWRRGQAGDFLPGRRRVLAQRAEFQHRQRGLQQKRQRHGHRGQSLLVRHRWAGSAVVARGDQPPVHRPWHRAGGERGRGRVGAPDRPHLRRRPHARHAARGPDHIGARARRSSLRHPSAC